MIVDPYSESWHDLQTGVRRLFRNVGLSADVEVDLQSPRGSVNVDVLAVDHRSFLLALQKQLVTQALNEQFPVLPGHSKIHSDIQLLAGR